MNDEFLLPNHWHNFAKIRLLRLYSRESASAKLFPLNGSRGLGGNVVKDAVDALYFIEDAVAGFPQQGRGEFHPVRRHGVFRHDGAQVGGPFIGTFVSLHAHRFYGDEAGVSLPDFVVPAVFLQVADEDGVAFPDDVQAFFGDHAGAAHGQAGAGEGVAPQNIMRDAPWRRPVPAPRP